MGILNKRHLGSLKVTKLIFSKVGFMECNYLRIKCLVKCSIIYHLCIYLCIYISSIIYNLSQSVIY